MLLHLKRLSLILISTSSLPHATTRDHKTLFSSDTGSSRRAPNSNRREKEKKNGPLTTLFLSSRCQQRIVATVEESVLRMEMAGLESQEEDASQRVLFYKPMAWLGQIRPHRRDESWSASLWQTFFSTSMGAQIPVIPEKPLPVCGCRKFKIDALGDHLCTCTSHSGAKKAHDLTTGRLINLLTFFVRPTRLRHNRWLRAGDSTAEICTVNLSDFYSYRLIGKLTAFLQLQEFSQRNQPVDSSTFAARLSLDCSNLGLEIS